MLKRAFLEGLKNITRSFWLSATAIFILTVSFASVAIFVALTSIAGFSVRNLDSLVSFPAFFTKDFPEEQIPQVLSKIQAIPEVRSAEYFDREQAQENLSSGGIGFNDAFLESAGSGENFAWRFILITPTTSEKYGSVLTEVKSDGFAGTWEEVFGDEEFVNRLIWWNQIFQWVSIILIGIFTTVSILVMANILRITIYNYRDEIEIMRLVGATNNYIRALFIPSFQLLLPQLQSFLGSGVNQDSTNLLIFQTYGIFFLAILLGTSIGILTSYMATQRYLKL
jgi:cell division transport system permease protein